MSQPPFIEKLILKRFRSIPNEAVQFDNPTILVGKNGSGKSNFVDVFAFLSECMTSPLQSVFDNRGGIQAVRNRTPGGGYPANLGIRADFRLPDESGRTGHYAFEVRGLANYSFEVAREQCVLTSDAGQRVWFDRTGSSFRTSLAGLRPAIDPQSLALLVVGGVEQLAPLLRAFAAMRVYAIEPTLIREMQDPDSGLVLRRDGSNVSSVLLELGRRDPEVIDRVCEILSAIVPGTTSVRPIRHGKKLTLKFTQQWAEGRTIDFEAFTMSDGTLRALGMLAAVMQQPAPSLLAIEEPEATIHPGALGAILDLIQMAAQRSQVIVTTHSPELLDAKWIGPDNLRVVYWEGGATRISPLGLGAIRALQQHLMGAGELFRANVLDSDPLFDPAPTPSLFDQYLT
jgi:predicted ATPase